MTNPQPTWPNVDRRGTNEPPPQSAAPPTVTAATQPAPGNGPVATLGIIAAIGLLFGALMMFQGGNLASLIFGGVLILCGVMTLTGALVATHIGARLERR